MDEKHRASEAADDDETDAAVIAADDTGMIRSEQLLVEAEMESRLDPPEA